MSDEPNVQPGGTEDTPDTERRNVFDNAFDRAMQTRKVGATRTAGKPAGPPIADNPTGPEVTKEADAPAGAKPAEEVTPPPGAKTKSWEEEARSRKEAETLAHNKAEEAADKQRRLEAAEAELATLRAKVEEITTKTAEAADQEIVALVTQTLKRMAEVDPEIDPGEYYQTLGKDLAEAIKQINSKEARKVAAELVREEIGRMKEEQAAKDNEAKLEAKKDNSLNWAIDQASKAGLDMSNGSWESRQFWRIFNNPHEISGDMSLADGVKKIIELVKQEKQELLSKGIKVGADTRKVQEDQQPLGRGSGETPTPGSQEPYQKRQFGDLLQANLNKRRIGARR